MATEERAGRLAGLRRFPILYGCFWALFMAAIGIVLVFLFAQYGSLGGKGITTAAYIIHCVAVLIGAIASSKSSDSRGWFYGGLTGLLYALLMVAIGLFVYNTFTMDASGIFRVLLMAVIGAFGGMIGMATRRDN